MAKITIRGGAYILDWRDETGRHRKSLGRVGVVPKKRVDDILKAKQLELSTGARLLNFKVSKAMPFSALAHEYMLWHQVEYPHSTARIQQIISDHLLPAFEYKAIDMIGEADVAAFKSTRNVKTQTLIKELRTLKAMLNFAVRKRYITESMVEHVSMPQILDSKPHRFYEVDELTRLYEKATDRHRAIWRLFVNTGVRRHEGLMLEKKWIGREELKILSTEDNRTKSGKWRVIPKSDGAAEALDQIKAEGKYVLPRMTLPSLSREAARDIKAAGLDGSLHTFRHTYISHLVRAGIPLRTVQIYAGHAHYSTTEGYAYLAPGSAPEAVMRLSL